MNSITLLLAQVPSWVWILLIVVGTVLIVVSIIKKAIKLAVIIGIICYTTSGTGLSIDYLVEQGKLFIDEHQEDFNNLQQKSKDFINEHQEDFNNLQQQSKDFIDNNTSKGD